MIWPNSCSGDVINTTLEYLSMSLCFGCGEDGVGLTPQSLEDAFYEELEGVDCIECVIKYVPCYNETPDGICPESFIMHRIGSGLTCEISSAQFNYKLGHNQLIYIGDLCIQVSGYDDFGKNVSGDSPELLADAWNAAMSITAAEFAAFNHSLTSAQYKALFLENLNITVDQKFSGYSISSGKCLGNIQASKPKYSILCY